MVTTNVFEKILYGQKVCNDNVVLLDEKVEHLLRKVEALLDTFQYEEHEEDMPESISDDDLPEDNEEC